MASLYGARDASANWQEEVAKSMWQQKVRKAMAIDVSKAHLYAPVGEGINTYVDLPPECSKLGACGNLAYWLYGMRPASHG